MAEARRGRAPRACVFCQIVAGAVPAHLVWQDAHNLALLDHAPLAPGHVLVLPRQHIQTLGDLPPAEVGPYFEAVRRLALAVERGMAADGAFVAINIRVSQSVPHLHTHVVPRRSGDGLFGRTFQWIRRPYPSPAAMAEAQRAVQSALAAEGLS